MKILPLFCEKQLFSGTHKFQRIKNNAEKLSDGAGDETHLPLQHLFIWSLPKLLYTLHDHVE